MNCIEIVKTQLMEGDRVRRGLEGVGYFLFLAWAVGTGASFITQMLSNTQFTRPSIAVFKNAVDKVCLPIIQPNWHGSSG